MFEDFSIYDDCEPLGVELPKTSVSETVLKSIDLDKKSSTKEIMYELARKGLRDKGITNFSNKKEYFDRTIQELETFEELGFTDYILLNWDVLNFCHENKIPTGAGRGSAAGSLVLYLLGVTNIDPIPHNLFFERFVSKSRAKKVYDKRNKEFLVGSLLPDVDSDISYDQRQKVIQYIEKKHEGRTAKILTFNTFSSKLCIREATKYFDEAKEDQANSVSDMIPKLHGKVSSLESAREENERFDSWAIKHDRTFVNAKRIENLIKNTGVHPSGIAICSQSIGDVVPLQKTKDGDLITGYNMHDVADLMVKFDILGLRTLTIAHRTCDKIGISVDDIDANDSFIYDKLQSYNHPEGLFQISADTNFRVCQEVKPDNLDELSDVVALARPAALQFVAEYCNQKMAPSDLNLHPELDKILSWSKNVILYQEQLMQIAHKVFGFTLEEAETLRRIVGKKKVDEMPAWEEKIYTAGEKLGLGEEICKFYWDALDASANYSFNKSHSFAYAELAAKTVYLKYKYPREFFLSVLESSEFDPDPLGVVSSVHQELDYFGIKLLPPNLFKSKMNFSIEGDDIRYGLNGIKGISSKSKEGLLSFKGSDGFEGKYDVFAAAKNCGINISVLAALIQAGAMDESTNKRGRLVLEAQAFNILTDREKRNFNLFKERFGDDILKAISEVMRVNAVADDGRPIMKESRFETFKRNFKNYKEIFDKNKPFQKFCNWWYENTLLGYSYSFDLRDCFEDEFGSMSCLRDVDEISERTSFKVVCQVKDFFTNISQSGNKYMMIHGSDNTGSAKFLIMDNSRSSTLSDFLSQYKISKDCILVLNASKGRGTSFVNSARVVDTKIMMKLKDLNKK
jgi:DNA polymerase-3 subunit alpha|tara:strand:+ start:7172 stop:9733 length:2562 start_codon:yes stop_codon:yes gene_type:complete